MAYVNFKELKEERPARNFDKVDITEDFDIGAQDGDSLYGTFSFFHGIKSFFKKVMSAASALVSGKILMSDENGNVTGITPSDLKTGMDLMNSEDVNNALTNYTRHKYLSVVFSKNSIDTEYDISSELTGIDYNKCMVYCTWEDGIYSAVAYSYFNFETRKLIMHFNNENNGLVRIGINIFY